MARARLLVLIGVPLLIAAVVGSAQIFGGDSKPVGKPAVTTTATPTVPSRTADPFATASASPKATASPTVKSAAGPCEGHVIYSVNAGVPGGPFIRAATTLPRKWGPECLILQSGDDCLVGFNASYSAPTEDAYIEFQAWAKGAKTPFQTRLLGPVPGTNRFKDVGFLVKLPKTDEVAFRLVLENEAKVPLAISDSYVYKVDCQARLS